MGAIVSPTCRGVGRSEVFRVVGTGVFGSGERGADPAPGFGDGLSVCPGAVETEPDLPGAVGDTRGDVQHEVAEGRDLRVSQHGRVGEPQEFGPAHQIRGREEGLQSRRVLVPTTTGKVA